MGFGRASQNPKGSRLCLRHRQEGRGKILERAVSHIVPVSPGQEPTYPALWNHNADAERTLIAASDSQAIIRQGRSSAEEAVLRERAAQVWLTASTCHFNYDFDSTRNPLRRC